MSVPDVDSPGEAAPPREQLQQDLKRTTVTGAAITVPLIITLLVLALVVDFISGLLNPVVGVLNTFGLGITGTQGLLVKALSLVVLAGVMFAVGLAAERRPAEGALTETFDAAMAQLPGVGSIYTGVNRMSEVLLESDTESFREVKLVEFPHHDTYVLGFLTASAPAAVERAAGHRDMLTLFVPLAPNPFVGGHLVTVPADRVNDVNMSVEEGIQAIVTSGVVVDEGTTEDR